jgi:hypothetical protein
VIDPKQGPLYHPGRGEGHNSNLRRILKAQGKNQLIQSALVKTGSLKLVK